MLRPQKLDGEGRLALSKEQLRRWRLGPSDEVLIRDTANGLVISPLDPPLGKIYVEPTTRCNLRCPMCVRQFWDEPIGDMSWEAFERIIAGVRKLGTCRQMAFWGIGEPLLHPHIFQMIAAANQLGLETEMITNGLLINETVANKLIEAGLDTIVFSIDGTSATTFGHDRAGADQDVVVENIRLLRRIVVASRHDRGFRRGIYGSLAQRPKIGLEFVATKENINDLPKLRELARSVGANFIVISNLLPYHPTMNDQILYQNSADWWYPAAQYEKRPDLVIGRMDNKAEYLEPLAAMTADANLVDNSAIADSNLGGYCRFVNDGTAAITWEGNVSPCIPLMHSYRCYVMGREKFIRRYAVGNIGAEALEDIWWKSDFVAFRQRVQLFDFSPCSSCGSCELAESNEEDCLGNQFPVCGDCLWGKGIIRCP